MNGYLSFEKMIAPILIKVIFWVASLIVILVGFFGMFVGEGFVGFIKGLLTIILGPIVIRVYCELLIIFFSINDHLREIRDNTKKA